MEAIDSSEIFLFEQFRLDRRGGGLFHADKQGAFVPVAIGSRALDVLYVLVDRHGRLVTKDEIRAAVWPGIAVADSNLPIQILTLRRVLDQGRAGGSCIQTVAGRGYRFVVSVKRAAGQDLPEVAEIVQATPALAERRPITVVSGGIVGVPASGAEQDPEELLDTMGALYRACAQVIGEYDGFVANFSGESFLAYFGYPAAHEDDAERALRAGLSLSDMIGRFEAPSRLQARIGIATGLVVIGDVIGEGERRRLSVVGAAPSLAARLQALAEPNTVLIAESTQRQVGEFFELHELLSVGLSQRIWRALRERRGLGRFEALRSTNTSLVGREEEMAALVRLWTRARAGDGHVVLLSGEPGVGKSRLAAEFEERIRDERHHRLRYFCSPYHQNSSLYPIIAQLDRAAGFERDDNPELKLGKLEGLLGALLPLEEEIALFADLLSLPPSAGYLSPQRNREKTFEVWLRLLDALARQQPVLIVFEDLQWIDPTSHELLDLVIERIESWPVMLIATFRPEFQSPWTDQPGVAAMSLNRLNRRNAAALVHDFAGVASELPKNVADAIIERCDSVPLFLEELTKAVAEEAAISSMPGKALAVPPTLNASLIARLDRLTPFAKEVAQIGAAIGRQFSLELVAAVATKNGPELQAAIKGLIEAGLVFQRGTPPQAGFLFKHALVQDAAYGTLLRARRQTLHARIADALLSEASEKAAVAPEIIAHHLEMAGRPLEAIDYWRDAGERAVCRAANREAIEHFRRALSLLEARAETPERWGAELAILSQLAPALMSVYGWSALEGGEAVERATDAARRLESSAELAPSIANLWLFNSARGRLDRVDEISADLFRIARELEDSEILLQAHHSAWAQATNRGLFAKAGEHIEAALALYDEQRHAHHRYVYVGHDPGVCALVMSAKTHWALGRPERARRLVAETLVLARRLRHAPSLAHALIYTCETRTVLSDIPEVRAAASELLVLSDEQGLVQAQASGLLFFGWALALSGDAEEGITRLEEGLSILNRIGARGHVTHYFCLMAEGLLSAGRYAEGLSHVTSG